MDFGHQLPQVFLVVHAVFVALLRPELMPEAIKIGIYPPFFFLVVKRDHRPACAGIVLVVVVDLAIPAMEIPRVRGVKR